MSNTALFISLIILIAISAFFSAAETALMSVNRYRVRHLAKSNNRTAQLISRLLDRPDRLLSVILLGNTFANIMASALATLLAESFFGEVGVVLCAVVLTLAMLVFAEITPKTLAAIRPTLISFYVVWPLFMIKKIFYPLIWFFNKVALLLLRCVGVVPRATRSDALNVDELRTLLNEAGDKIPPHNKAMLLAVLDLSTATVQDVMLPKYKMPALEPAKHAYYIPATTPLSVQLAHFQKTKQHTAIVVDEYGDILGQVTLEDILEEIVGEFKHSALPDDKLIRPEKGGHYSVDGSISIRDLNRELGLEIPTDLAKTLSGAIIEYLEIIPREELCLRLSGYPMEILKMSDNIIKSVRILSTENILPS